MILSDVAHAFGALSEGSRVFFSFILTTKKKKTEEATKAILLSKVKNTNRRVLDDKEVNRRVVGAIEGKSKGSLVDLLIYARYKVVFLAN